MTSRLAAWAQMPVLRFGLVGAGGFLIDTAVLYALNAQGLDLYSGRAVSYFVAASATWAGNRYLTFPKRRAHGAMPIAAEWLRFLIANLGGGAVNYGVYAGLVSLSATMADLPVIAVAIGSLSGMAVNFLASKTIVFRK